MDTVPKKVKWADISDDDPLPPWPPPEPPTIVSKHGIKCAPKSSDKQKPLAKDK